MNSNDGKRKIFMMELEQVFDVWSLVFCIARMHVCNFDWSMKYSNEQYKQICGFSIRTAVSNLVTHYQMPTEQIDAIIQRIEHNFTTVKPWIPSVQILDFIRKNHDDTEVVFTSNIEEKYWQILKEMHPTIFEDVKILEANKCSSEDSLFQELGISPECPDNQVTRFKSYSGGSLDPDSNFQTVLVVARKTFDISGMRNLKSEFG